MVGVNNFRRVQLMHLIKMMFAVDFSKAQVRFSSYLKHPFFKTVEELVTIENRAWSFLCAYGYTLFDEDGKSLRDSVEQMRSEVIGEHVRSWVDRLPIEDRHVEPKYRTTYLGFLGFKRNYSAHPKLLESELMPPPVENFFVFERAFPKSSLTFHLRLGAFIPKAQEKLCYHPSLQYIFAGSPNFKNLFTSVEL